MTNNVVAETETKAIKAFKQCSSSSFSLYSFKFCLIFFFSICITIFIFPQSPNFLRKWQNVGNANVSCNNCSSDLKAMVTKLRDSVTFLPLKDLRYAQTAEEGHTWFMSSMIDTHEEGEVQYQQFPSKASKGRLLCILGSDNHDGSLNSYALAWPEALPHNATLLKGLTFVSYNHYDYGNIWHGLTAMIPFVGWHRTIGSCRIPNRWVLYHWGEVRTKMGSWLRYLMEATFNVAVNIEVFDGIEGPACFEEAVVMRHNEGGMSMQRRMEVFDLLRCKARVHCNVSIEGSFAEVNDKGVPDIGLTMFMRIGTRSFKNETAVIEIFREECLKVEGCKFRVGHSDNLSFCDQV